MNPTEQNPTDALRQVRAAQMPNVPKWPFYLGDLFLLVTAMVIAVSGEGDLLELSALQISGTIACVFLGGILFAIPYIIEHRARVEILKSPGTIAEDLMAVHEKRLKALSNELDDLTQRRDYQELAQRLDEVEQALRNLQAKSAGMPVPKAKEEETPSESMLKKAFNKVAPSTTGSIVENMIRKQETDSEPRVRTPAPFRPSFSSSVDKGAPFPSSVETEPGPRFRGSTPPMPKPESKDSQAPFSNKEEETPQKEKKKSIKPSDIIEAAKKELKKRGNTGPPEITMVLKNSDGENPEEPKVQTPEPEAVEEPEDEIIHREVLDLSPSDDDDPDQFVLISDARKGTNED